MKDFAFEHDEKSCSFSVEHSNILKDLAKEYDDALNIKPFQVAVQLAYDKDLQISDTDAVEKVMVDAATDVASEVRDAISDLYTSIVKLKKEEDAGNTKAADEAEKLVKSTKKSLEKLAGEFGMKCRQMVEAVLKKQAGEKVKLRSVSRTGLRGLELDEDYFEGGEEEVSRFVGEVGKGLAAAGTEAFKLSNEEKDARQGLADAVKDLKNTLDKYIDDVKKGRIAEDEKKGVKKEDAVAKADKWEFDLALWAKNHAKEVNKIEQTKDKYVEFLNEFERKLNVAKLQLDKFIKLIEDEKSLEDDKDLAKEIQAFQEARETILGTLEGKQKAAALVDRLFSDDYSKGATFIAAFRTLEAQKGTTKSGKAMQEAGRAIEKATKG